FSLMVHPAHRVRHPERYSREPSGYRKDLGRKQALLSDRDASRSTAQRDNATCFGHSRIIGIYYPIRWATRCLNSSAVIFPLAASSMSDFFAFSVRRTDPPASFIPPMVTITFSSGLSVCML